MWPSSDGSAVIADLDLLVDTSAARRAPMVARLRRGLAMFLVVTTFGLVLALVEGARPAAMPREDPSPSGRTRGPEHAATTPSRILAASEATAWRMAEMSLRPDGHLRAIGTLRFEAPPGGPALPERLSDALARDPALTELVPVALTATGDGTAVELAGPIVIDVAPRAGTPVASADLPGHLAGLVEASGGRVRGILASGPTEVASVAAVALSFDATPPDAVRILASLEDGVSAPSRMSSLRIRRVEDLLSVELVMTARPLVVVAP